IGILVIDRTKLSVTATWPQASANAIANYPMALDEAHHRLFVGYRSPSTLVVYNMDTGQPVSHVECAGDAGDLFYDADSRRIYVTGGHGFLTVFQQIDPNHYDALANFPIPRGARTSLFVPELNRLYLAVPHSGKQPSEIRVYEVQP